MLGGWKPKSDIPSLIKMYLNQVTTESGFIVFRLTSFWKNFIKAFLSDKIQYCPSAPMAFLYIFTDNIATKYILRYYHQSCLMNELVIVFYIFYTQEIQVDEYISHNMPLEDINQAFDLMKEGKCLRCVLHMPK